MPSNFYTNLLMVSLLGVSSGFAVAAEDAEPVKTAAQQHEEPVITERQEKALFNISKQGSEAMSLVQNARLALFSGYTDKAKQFTNQAVTILLSDESSWKDFVKENKKFLNTKDDYIVIDTNVSVIEDYVQDEEKQKAIGRANEKFHKGDHQGAIEELRLAGIGVTITNFLMPLDYTLKATQKAQALLADAKYYEAGLALKSAEDGVITETQTATEVPSNLESSDRPKSK